MGGVRTLISKGELLGIFENNLGGHLFYNKQEVMNFFIRSRGMGPLDTISQLMSISISDDICRVIKRNIQGLVGFDEYFEADPYEDLEFLD